MRTFPLFVLLLGVSAASAAANDEPMRVEIHVWGGSGEARTQFTECVHRQLEKYDEWSVRVVPEVPLVSAARSHRWMQLPVEQVMTRTHHEWGSETESFDHVVLKLTCPQGHSQRTPWNPHESPTK